MLTDSLQEDQSGYVAILTHFKEYEHWNIFVANYATKHVEFYETMQLSMFKHGGPAKHNAWLKRMFKVFVCLSACWLCANIVLLFFWVNSP